MVIKEVPRDLLGSAQLGWQLRLDLLVDICIADFDFNGNYLKLRCANL